MQVKPALEFLGLALSSLSQSRNTVLALGWICSDHRAALSCMWSLLCGGHISFPFFQRGGYWYLSTFCHSQWLLAVHLGLYLGLDVGHLFLMACLKEVVLIYSSTVGSLLMVQTPSLQLLSLSLVTKTCSFLSLLRSAYFYSLWWSVLFIFFLRGWSFLFSQKLLDFSWLNWGHFIIPTVWVQNCGCFILSTVVSSNTEP